MTTTKTTKTSYMLTSEEKKLPNLQRMEASTTLKRVVDV